ncbi:alpha/beta fold hydrolase [Alkalihalobacillus sp. CinArs1]|uniref:alpha/beta fold hydrolase n=1 Tax=Alkalihalobacillus sp. CinArs1 TaxID=2995314 RepID=UPI0022DD6080|nr:alpha/beta hydrolase [Alkalihalobacillus sp. CinArs1]
MNRFYINVNEKNVRVTEWGNEDKPTIFCLHGLGSTSLSFIEIAEGLKERYHIIAVDAPGHGKSESFDREEDYEMPKMVEWLNRVLDRLNIHAFYFLSHSWGSFVTLFYLKENREKVKGSLLLDGGYQSKRESQLSMEEEAASYEIDFEDYMESWESFREHAAYGAVTRRTPSLDLAAEDLLLMKGGKYYWHARGKTGSSIVKAMHKHEIMDIYKALPAEIILLRATLPEERESERSRMASVFEKEASAIVELVPHSTHMLHWDQPEYVISVITQRWV